MMNQEYEGSVEGSLNPPYRYSMVCPGIYRGAYPCLPNFRFLSRLQLKTVLSLTPEEPSADIKAFTEMAGATVIHCCVQRVAPLNDALLQALLPALQVCIDSNNYPIYIHCLDGRRITSLLVMLLRKVQAWTLMAALTEFWRFQVAFKPLIPTSEVEKTSRDLEKFWNESLEITYPVSPPKWLVSTDKVQVHGVKVKAAIQ